MIKKIHNKTTSAISGGHCWCRCYTNRVVLADNPAGFTHGLTLVRVMSDVLPKRDPDECHRHCTSQRLYTNSCDADLVVE